MLPLLAIGAGLGLVNGVSRIIGGAKQKRAAKAIHPIWQQYQTNPYAKAQLGLARQMFNGRMAGAGAMEQNIASNAANTVSNINRAATDSSQALALATGTQGQADKAYQQLAINEAQNKQEMLGNLNAAYGQMVNEGDKEYNSMLQKYQMDVQRKDALQSSGAQNQYGAISDMSSMAFGLAGLQNAGGLNFGFGGRRGLGFHDPKYRDIIGTPIQTH